MAYIVSTRKRHGSMERKVTPALLGVETGGAEIITRIVGHNVVEEARWPTTTPDAALSDILNFVESSLPSGHCLEAAALAAFGPLILEGPDRGRILTSSKLDWIGSNLRASLAENLGVEVGIDTDVNAAAIGELAFGAGKGLPSIAYVTIGTGIGAGLATASGTLKGALHPEIGHWRVERDLADYFPSVCPFHDDCVEGLASGAALAARLNAPTSVGAAQVQMLCAEYVAQLMVGLVLAWSPHRIIIGGGVGKSPGFLDMVRSAYREKLDCYGVGSVAHTPDFIVAAALDDSGLEGALQLAKAISPNLTTAF